MQNQKRLFDLADDITYLNGAYMSPQLLSVTKTGLHAIQRKARPYEITPEDFFTEKDTLKQRFATLIAAADFKNIAIIPSVSYGMANAANNIPLQNGDEILLIDEQFPSNVYIWQEVAKKNSKAIRKKTKEVHAKLIIDGTQSIGALPFSVKDIQPDALVCGGYKWLLGPYSLGMAYYSDDFNDGTPIEHNWINRYNSQDFKNLTTYQNRYQKKAARYSVGESSNFILTPMLSKAIEQLIQWTPEYIQNYCKIISQDTVQKLRSLGCFVEEDNYRSHHLFGIYLPNHIDIQTIKTELAKKKIFVSYRGNAIRVSCHLYNTKKDFENLLAHFE